MSGVACIFCGLLQGQEDPDLKNLQVVLHFKSKTTLPVILRSSSPSLANSEPLPPSPSSTCTLLNFTPQSSGRLHPLTWFLSHLHCVIISRNQAVGTCSLVARMGGISALLLDNLKVISCTSGAS